MKVGNVAETVTVSGETPMVDLQSTAQTVAANAKAFKELPTGGSWVNMAQLIPAVNLAFFGTRRRRPDGRSDRDAGCRARRPAGRRRAR
jgi:hypothetical protein